MKLAQHSNLKDKAVEVGQRTDVKVSCRDVKIITQPENETVVGWKLHDRVVTSSPEH